MLFMLGDSKSTACHTWGKIWGPRVIIPQEVFGVARLQGSHSIYIALGLGFRHSGLGLGSGFMALNPKSLTAQLRVGGIRNEGLGLGFTV